MDNPHDALGGTPSLKDTLTVQVVDGTPIKCFGITRPTRGIPDLADAPYTQFRTEEGMLQSPLELEDDSDSEASDDSWTEMEEKMMGRLNDYFNGRRSRPNTESPEPQMEFDWGGDYTGPTIPASDSQDDYRAPRIAINPARWEYCMRDVNNMANLSSRECRTLVSREDLHAYLDKLYHEGEDLYKRYKDQMNAPVPAYLHNGSAILRTYQTDIELLAPTLAMSRTICNHPIPINLDPEQDPDHQLAYMRMNMSLAIPQLSLAIVAQQRGYVALLTLTRLSDRESLAGPIVSFRLDAVLPTNEQLAFRANSLNPLLGIAAAPVQAEGVTRDTAKRWRLILHFFDHSIMSYELSRDENNANELTVL
jgi:hypothetical protein